MWPHLADLQALIKDVFDVLDLVVLRAAMLGLMIIGVYKLLKAH